MKLNLTIVMVTHDPTVAAYADRQLHVMDGKIVEVPQKANPMKEDSRVSA
jgi:ABC-type lipoprotein export system ATPase subunit